jgi:hypothetical protein
MQKAELPESLDRGEFDPFFAAIGRLVASWGHLEQALDTVIRLIHSGKIIPAPKGEMPRTLEWKIRYFRAVNREQIDDARVRHAYKEICDAIEKHGSFRHGIIHGFVLEFDPGGVGARFGRYHRTKVDGEIQEYHVAIEDVSGEVMQVQDLAKLLARLVVILSRG